MGARLVSCWFVAFLGVVLVGCGNGDDTGSGGSGGAGGSGGGSLACRFDATVDGEFSATFDGAAEWAETDGALLLTLRSRDLINGGSDPFLVTVETDTIDSVAPGSFTIVAGSVSSTGSTSWSAIYMQGVPGFDCPNCGGTVEIETVNGDSVTGGFALEAPVQDPDDGGEVSVGTSFTALSGSAYSSCEATYE